MWHLLEGRQRGPRRNAALRACLAPDWGGDCGVPAGLAAHLLSRCALPTITAPLIATPRLYHGGQSNDTTALDQFCGRADNMQLLA